MTDKVGITGNILRRSILGEVCQVFEIIGGAGNIQDASACAENGNSKGQRGDGGNIRNFSIIPSQIHRNQSITPCGEEGNNQKYSPVIPTSKPAGFGGKKGNNTFRVIPPSPSRFAELV